MPRQDATGPAGMGAMSGRGFGWKMKFGARRGLGRYFNWGWPQSMEERKKALAEHRMALKEELEAVKREEAALSKKEGS
ncbi:MAG: DUF5320 domain-containing protein [Candidatus Woesebacteria bacterium]